MRCNSKIHVIKDESLGGVEREYIEVERKAEVGDIAIQTSNWNAMKGNIAKVDYIADDCSGISLGNQPLTHYEYRVLEPTDIVHIDSIRYRMVDRKAEVGERVIQTSKHLGNEGKVFAVTGVVRYEVILNHYTTLSDSDYHVLIPAESSDSETSPQSQEDIIANLVRRMAHLESELTGAKRDIETWAREVEAIRYTNEELYSRLGHVEADTEEFDEKVEMIIDDIVTLDERTNLSQEITISVAELIKLIGGAR